MLIAQRIQTILYSRFLNEMYKNVTQMPIFAYFLPFIVKS